MAVNGIGNSTASWAQFVKLSQAARDRNSGLTPEAAGVGKAASAPQTAAVSFRRVADVYSGNRTPSVQSAAVSVSNEINRKAVGGQFDAYA